MKFDEVGFRAFYHQFVLLPLDNRLRLLVKHIPEARKAQALLTYAYIDHEAGLTLEVLDLAFLQGDSYLFDHFDKSEEIKIRIGYISSKECRILPDTEGILANRYRDQLSDLAIYSRPDLEAARSWVHLDQTRSPEYPDDFLVGLLEAGKSPEGVWVRLEKIGENELEGILLNEPNQDFGKHMGDSLVMRIYQLEDQSFMILADLDLEGELSDKG